MFTYGYIREAALAHADLSDTEAGDMQLRSRFNYYANEAMQAICASRPRYDYINISVVDKLQDVVYNQATSSFVPATEEDYIVVDNEIIQAPGVIFGTDEQKEKYWHDLNIYAKGELYTCDDNFIAFAPNKQAFINDKFAKINYDYSVLNGNKIKFYHTGEYRIPARFMWFNFNNINDDNTEIDMPADIILTIPLYVASIYLQIDNTQKSQLMRQDFELALARCVPTDRMMNTSLKATW